MAAAFVSAKLSVYSLLNIVSCWALGLFGCFLNMFSLWTPLDAKLQPMICCLELETFGGILQGLDVSKVPWKSGASHCLCQENSFKAYCKAEAGDVIRGQSLSISLFVILICINIHPNPTPVGNYYAFVLNRSELLNQPYGVNPCLSGSAESIFHSPDAHTKLSAFTAS